MIISENFTYKPSVLPSTVWECPNSLKGNLTLLPPD